MAATDVTLLSHGEELRFEVYEHATHLAHLRALIDRDLSEPYSRFTYLYFVKSWPHLCFLVYMGQSCVGAIVCKHDSNTSRGYIAMLVVDQSYRRQGVGKKLILKAVDAMLNDGCNEIVLETEVTNAHAIRLYEKLGFCKDKKLARYYMNGVDAFRLKLWMEYPNESTDNSLDSDDEGDPPRI